MPTGGFTVNSAGMVVEPKLQFPQWPVGSSAVNQRPISAEVLVANRQTCKLRRA